MAITIIDRKYNGAPSIAENELFSWHLLSPDFLTCKQSDRAIYGLSYMRKDSFGSDAITDNNVIEAVQQFWSELRDLEKKAVEQYAAKKAEKEEADFYLYNPCLNGLSKNEIARRAKVYDKVYNEGAEGFNPYR